MKYQKIITISKVLAILYSELSQFYGFINKLQFLK